MSIQITNFKQKVLEVVRAIPRGQIMSYGQVASAAGSPGASRAVGSIMSHNQDLSIPCHRVVRSDGSIGQYNGLRTKQTGAQSKLELLRSEGIKISPTNKVIIAHSS
jgi:O-6-methylguanine DNA methyltransferase